MHLHEQREKQYKCYLQQAMDVSHEGMRVCVEGIGKVQAVSQRPVLYVLSHLTNTTAQVHVSLSKVTQHLKQCRLQLCLLVKSLCSCEHSPCADHFYVSMASLQCLVVCLRYFYVAVNECFTCGEHLNQ